MISQFFILTPRGDTVVSKDYRGDCPRGEAAHAQRPAPLPAGSAFVPRPPDCKLQPPPLHTFSGSWSAHTTALSCGSVISGVPRSLPPRHVGHFLPQAEIVQRRAAADFCQSPPPALHPLSTRSSSPPVTAPIVCICGVCSFVYGCAGGSAPLPSDSKKKVAGGLPSEM